MKLDKQGVEKAAIAVSLTEDPMLPFAEQYRTLTRAALTAYFDHLKSEGLMQDAMGILAAPYGRHWVAATQPTTGDFKCFIIRTDKE